MAGGKSKRGDWGPRADRIRPANDPASQAAPALPLRVKHCWVLDHNGRLPALLLEWRRIGEEYDGRVVRLVHEDGAWIVVGEWLPATMLEKAAD